MKVDVINTYLYISWNPGKNSEEGQQYFNSYMAVVKAMIHEEISIGLENIGDGGIIFSSYLSFDDIKERVRHRKFPYLIIDLSINIQTNTLDGYLTKTDIKKLKEFVNHTKEIQLLSLETRLSEAVESDDYEKAIFYRDLIKDKRNG